MSSPFFTIRHSTRSVEEFAGLLSWAQVQLVADVRTVPRSRTNPQFNRDTLPGSLAAYQIKYEHVSELGGLGASNAAQGPLPTRFGTTRASGTMPTMHSPRVFAQASPACVRWETSIERR